MVRGRDACWEHCVLVDATRQKVRCNYCHREFSGGVYRMKFHLAQIKNKDIIPCGEVPDDVRDHIQSILSIPKKRKTPKKQKVDRAANGQQNSSSASGGLHPNHGSSGQHVACPKGTLYLKSVDISGHEDDANYLFELLVSIVLEVGVENVIQVITDNAASYVYAGRLLMAKYSSLFWSPCASYCIDKMLEDISKLEWVGTVLEEANTITRITATSNMPSHSSLGDWWAAYGYEIPTLQRVAIRILSQPCSSHWCRWNWSTFESIHSKKRNKMELEKLNDLVFVHCNLWLESISQSMNGKCKPIIHDEIDVNSEWPTELESSTPLLDNSWLDNLPLECRDST
ncbi:hypothetical protein GH714_008841 [Hevea brasiliensis]|uniref:BED-type domain-containing protein n=1 Tax=Hevea brasiliensis TaxID=3981 RepID=A0A6A6N335_HEVBR|nr:hypothetical protein GH714_008841 [Hevea brasiliensis]